MPKFLVKNVVIEKSVKDIKTGINYEFDEGLNLIAGNNEAGKSSLMTFIKDGFFRVKGIDTGKIYFDIAGKTYRADIKDNRATDKRCKLFDEDNTAVDYSFLEKMVNQKYFEQGFSISLDDLMNIQNKDTSALVDVIKDPSGEKLTVFTEQIKSDAKKIFGDNGRLTKETAGILEKISAVNLKINELSNKETQYNNAVNSIKITADDIELLCRKEEFLNIQMELQKLEKKLAEVNENKRYLEINFNEKLFSDKETYISILQNAGKYETNLKNIEKNNNKLENINSKINSNINRLKNEFFVDINISDLKEFNLDFNKIKNIKDLLIEKNSLEKEIITNNANKENIEENLLKLKHELSSIKEKSTEIEKSDYYNELFNYIDEQLKQYNYLLSSLNDEKETNNTKGNKKIFILFCILLSLSVISSIISFIFKAFSIGICTSLISVLCLFGLYMLKPNKHTDKQDKNANLKNNILNDLKARVKEYSPEIVNTDNSYLPFKLENIKQELQSKIQNINAIKDLLSKNNTEVNYNSEKLQTVKNKIEEINAKINSIKREIKDLVKASTEKINIKEDVYLETADIIKNLKEDVNEKELLEQEITDLNKEKILIEETFSKFILQNQLNISLSERFEDNINTLKIYNEKNSEIKNQLDILNVEIENIQNKLEKLYADKTEYCEFDKCSFNIEEELNELKLQKEEQLNRKKEFEFQKRELESFEGLNDLKIEKNILLDEYRKKIAELMKNKLILSMIETAKNNFDKIQPDLQNAQKYLAILTDGKYSRINLDLEEIQNEDKSVTKKWNELSRGTKEQVYLALRLGYASNYSKDKTTLEPNGRADLPLIIDDAFVNFDFDRTKNALRCLIEFSKTNQVLFFTCHTNVIKQHFEALNEKINIINL